jgi:hypothetical protein
MPQFDRIQFLTQIFWISLSLIGIYFLIIIFYPRFYFVPDKIRKKLILLREKSISFIGLSLPVETHWEVLMSYLDKNQDRYQKNEFESDFIGKKNFKQTLAKFLLSNKIPVDGLVTRQISGSSIEILYKGCIIRPLITKNGIIYIYKFY